MIITFTGSRGPLTLEQARTLKNLLNRIADDLSDPVTEVNHGDSVGGDTGFHKLIVSMKLTRKEQFNPDIHLFPTNIPGRRAYSQSAQITEEEAQPSLRNKLMVDRCTHLISAPEDGESTARSYTWSTIRYAKALGGKKITIILRDGQIKEF